MREQRASLLLKLGRPAESEKIYWELLGINPDNYRCVRMAEERAMGGNGMASHGMAHQTIPLFPDFSLLPTDITKVCKHAWVSSQTVMVAMARISLSLCWCSSRSYRLNSPSPLQPKCVHRNQRLYSLAAFFSLATHN